MNRRTPPMQENKPKSKKGLIIFSLIVVIYLAIIMFGDHGYLVLNDLNDDKKNVQADLTEDSLKLKELKKQKTKLLNDDQYIEKVAREKFNMQKEGETVYKIEKDKTTKPDSTQN